MQNSIFQYISLVFKMNAADEIVETPTKLANDAIFSI
jgi:hypothetical protein